MVTRIFRHFYVSSFSYKDLITKTPQESRTYWGILFPGV